MSITDEQLMFGEPISIEGVGDFIQPKVKEIARLGNDNYFNIIVPFLITNENIKEQFNGSVYDLLFMKGNEILLQQLIICLNIFFKQDIDFITNINKIAIKIGEKGIISANNFEIIQDIVRKVHCIKLPTPEKLPKNMTPEKLKIHEKMKFHRNRRAKIDEPTFKEIINTVMHKGKSFIPYDVVGDFTYYQLINSYQVIVGLSNFDEYMGYKLSPKYELKEDMPHWQKIIKMI